MRSRRPIRLKMVMILSSLIIRRVRSTSPRVETFAKGLHLIAIISEADNIYNAIVLEIEHELLMLSVECDAHNRESVAYCCKRHIYREN